MRCISFALVFFLIPVNLICSKGDDVVGNTFFHSRSQGINLARHMVGTLHPFLPYSDCNLDFFINTISYGTSSNEPKLAQFMFFNGTDTMKFGPKNKFDTDVFALNFLLDDNFEGTVTAKPSIQNMITEFHMHYNFKGCLQNFYFDVYTPITFSRWDLLLEETIASTGNNIPANTFGNTMPESSSLGSIIEAWKGETINQGNFPAINKKRQFGNVNGRQTEGRLADIQTVLGYHIVQRDDLHLDINARFILPAGNKPDAQFLFEPLIGNGKHTAVGLGFGGYYELWEFNSYSTAELFFQATAYHYFKATNKRMFDLSKNGVGSRYLMFKRFNTDGTFEGEILFGPNVTTRRCSINIDVMSDIAIMGRYQRKELRFDLGLSLWIRSKEKIKIKSSIQKNTFGIQGSTTTIDNNTASNTKINGSDDQPDPIPVFLKTEDLNLSSAAHPAAASTKIFTFLSYLWCNHPNTPFIGLGGEYENSQFQNKALDQWAGWIKIGFSF